MRPRSVGSAAASRRAGNGSGFIAEATRAFVEKHEAFMFLSPPYMPEYNSSAEAGIGSMKMRGHHQAALHDCPGEWTCDDLEAARCQANETARPWGRKGPTPDEACKDRKPITSEEREAFARDVLKWERILLRGRESEGKTKPEIPREERDALRRRAVSTTLMEHGFLKRRRGRFTSPKAA